MGYVARYRKKPPKPKKKVVADAAPAPKTEGKEAENSREPEEE